MYKVQETRQLKPPVAIYAQLTDILAYTTQMYKVQSQSSSETRKAPVVGLVLVVGPSRCGRDGLASFALVIPQP